MNGAVLETIHLTTGYVSQRRERKVVSADLSLALIGDCLPDRAEWRRKNQRCYVH